ncbi:MAG: hypothetical protein HFH48_08110, partial [Lachnospiraceae bacterium]|nr:hypothetical protein [Lachnospiraceae bacterium]
MAVIEIVLLVIGVVMMIASFFITEKLSNQELDKIANLSTEEMKHILERSLTDAQVKVDNMVDQVVDHSIEKSMEVVERALDKETNEKMRAITEYSDTVLESIQKTHNEVMFLYSMLNDKHSELTKYAGNLAQLAIHLEELQENIQTTLKESDNAVNRAQDVPHQQQIPEPAVLPEEPQVQLEEIVSEEQEEELMNHNQKILDMYREGKGAVE